MITITGENIHKILAHFTDYELECEIAHRKKSINKEIVYYEREDLIYFSPTHLFVKSVFFNNIHNKISMIKVYRGIFSSSLKDAKDTIDTYFDTMLDIDWTLTAAPAENINFIINTLRELNLGE